MIVTFLLLNGTGVALAPKDAQHDTFQWLAEIWIPSAVGLATVAVTAVALWVSHRATKLANAVEEQRVAGEEARDARDARQRLQDMALGEARALTRWVNVAASSAGWQRMKIEEVGPGRHGPTLAAEARVLLQQSLVPGAEELLELTELLVENLYSHTPDATYMPDHRLSPPSVYATSDLLREVVGFRRNRMLDVIRGWALDPDRAVADIATSLNEAERKPDAYWDYRRGLGVSGLMPLKELPNPPDEYWPRVAFLRQRGVIDSRWDSDSSV